MCMCRNKHIDCLSHITQARNVSEVNSNGAKMLIRTIPLFKIVWSPDGVYDVVFEHFCTMKN